MNTIENITRNEINNLILSDKAHVLYVFDKIKLDLNIRCEFVEYRFVDGKRFLYEDESLDLVVIGPGIDITKDLTIEIERVLKKGSCVIITDESNFLSFKLYKISNLFNKVQIYKLRVTKKFTGIFKMGFIFVAEKKRFAKVSDKFKIEEKLKLKESLANVSMCKKI